MKGAVLLKGLHRHGGTEAISGGFARLSPLLDVVQRRGAIGSWPAMKSLSTTTVSSFQQNHLRFHQDGIIFSSKTDFKA